MELSTGQRFECEQVIHRMGADNAREIVRLSYRKNLSGISSEAFDLFKRAAAGHSGIFHPGNAREGIEALRLYYPDIKPES